MARVGPPFVAGLRHGGPQRHSKGHSAAAHTGLLLVGAPAWAGAAWVRVGGPGVEAEACD